MQYEAMNSNWLEWGGGNSSQVRTLFDDNEILSHLIGILLRSHNTHESRLTFSYYTVDWNSKDCHRTFVKL